MAADPRIQPPIDTPNEILLDRSIRRGLYLEQHKNHLVRESVGRLNARTIPRIEAHLESGLRNVRVRGPAVGPHNHKTLARTLTRVDQIRREELSAIRNDLGDDLVDLAEDERDNSVGLLTFVMPAATIYNVTRGQLRTVVTQRPLDGRRLTEWFRQVNTTQSLALRRAVQLGIVQGDRTEQILRRIRGTQAAGFRNGVFNRMRVDLERVVRSAAGHTAMHSRQMLYVANPEVVRSQVWVAVFDSRTCMRCMGMDGRRYPVGSAIVPPIHLLCRCLLVPVGPGQPPQAITYEKWLRKQPQAVQEDALGVKRAIAFARKANTVRTFVNLQGRTLTLEELRAKNADAFRGL